MINYAFKDFVYGLINKNDPQDTPDGAAFDSKNWITVKAKGNKEGGKIELVRGYAPLGTETEGVGRVTGLIVGQNANGVDQPFYSEGKKVRYYDSTLGDWVEIGTDILGTAADGEDITFAKFESRAGKQVWLNSPNSGPKKIMVANPGSYTDMYDSSKNYKAWLRIISSQAYNWNIDNKDRNALRLSYIEVRGLSDYTQIVAEVLGAGNGVTKTFPGTLAFKGAGAKRSCLDVSVTDGVETFADNQDGTLTGSLGGTGTINYTSGVISVTFNTAPLAVNITATYRWVDETANGGIANFVVPGTRVSGDPNVFRQDTGGDIKTLFSLKEHRFVAHEKSFYDLTLSLDDTDATNFLFRENFGITSLRGGYETAEGIYTVDLSDSADPTFVIIGYGSGSTEIRPFIISENLDLSDYRFDDLVVFKFAEFILYSCKYKDSSANDTTFIFNRITKVWDKLDYCISCADIYNGTLIAGDSLSKNVYTLFSGLDANGAGADNFWTSGITNLKIRQLKKVKKISLEGDIGPNQTLRMFVSLDRGEFVEVTDSQGNSIIQGSGAYVDHSQRVHIGAPVLGSDELGGGSDGIEAYHYNRVISLAQDKFSDIQIKFDVTDIGYASVNELIFRDVRVKQDKVARKYRV